MKKVKYLSIMTLLLGTMTFACNEEVVGPLRGGEDEDEDPIIIDPPPNVNPIDSLGG